MPGTDYEEDPDEVRENCINRFEDLLEFVTDCIANFPHITNIPRDLVQKTDDVIQSVFGTPSKEMGRYQEYHDDWNSFDRDVRREWLVKLRADIRTALARLNSTSSHRYGILGFGVVENELGMGTPVLVRLGIQRDGSNFLERLAEISRRVQASIELQANDLAAFGLRKILELSILERYRKDERMDDIVSGGRVLGLDKLIGKASSSAGGFLHPNLVRQLLDNKLVMDLAVHTLYYEPSGEDLETLMREIRVALAELRISEL